MDIKNIYTNAKEEVIDFLLRYLSQHNISYVRVEDEVHFLDKIYDELIEFTTIEGRIDAKYPISDYNNKKKLIKMQNRSNNLKLKNSRK